MEEFKRLLVKKIQLDNLNTNQTVVTNARHYESLVRTQASLEQVISGLNMGVTHDLLAQDIQYALYSLGEITGEITTDDLLGTIFSKFCIGK